MDAPIILIADIRKMCNLKCIVSVLYYIRLLNKMKYMQL